MSKNFSNAHAVVVGAGISGLLSARVLSKRFERVSVIDRDAPPGGPKARAGVPQGRHLHSLATKGSEILEGLFPGLDAELSEAGSPLVDQSLDTITDLPAGRMPRFRSGITMRAASRGLLEWRIRRRLEAVQNVRFVPGVEVAELLGDTRKVEGVKTKARDNGSSGLLAADFVLDASGASSRAPRWLEGIGCEPPRETVVDARLGYATRWYRVPEDFAGDWKSLAVLPGWPHDPRGGSLREVEGGLWTAVLVGIGGDYPPTGDEEFLQFARGLSSGVLYDAIRDAEPVSSVHGYRRTANRRRHYERTKLPRNFFVIGDAACVLNPTYGQGMTTAALSALALEKTLSEERSQSASRRFQRRQTKAVSPAWTTTANSDRQWSVGSVKELGRPRRFLHKISGEVMKIAAEDERTAKTLLEVKNLTAPPRSLLRPRIILPALWRSVF